MTIFILIVLCLLSCLYVLYYFLLPIIKPLQLVSNRISRKIQLYYLGKGGMLKGKQRDRYPIIVQYNPPEGINSAEAGFLLHRYVSSTDFFSLFYKWQAEGLIEISIDKIKDGEKIKIKRMKDISNSPLYEKIFFDKLFGKLIVRELTRFSDISSLCDTKMLENYGVEKGWFYPRKKWKTLKDELIHNGKFVRVASFILVMFVILILYDVFSFKYGIFFLNHGWIEDIFPVLRFVIFVIGLGIQNFERLERTDEGDKIVSQILGYRMFIKQCDENKLKELIKSEPMYFSEIVSYAVVFGLETSLLKNIIPMLDKYIDPFDGYYGERENLSDFSDVL